MSNYKENCQNLVVNIPLYLTKSSYENNFNICV